jgi:hypothetical protein
MHKSGYQSRTCSGALQAGSPRRHGHTRLEKKSGPEPAFLSSVSAERPVIQAIISTRALREEDVHAISNNGVSRYAELSVPDFRSLERRLGDDVDRLVRFRVFHRRLLGIVGLGLPGEGRQRCSERQSGDYRLPHVCILLDRGAMPANHPPVISSEPDSMSARLMPVLRGHFSETHGEMPEEYANVASMPISPHCKGPKSGAYFRSGSQGRPRGTPLQARGLLQT